MKEAQIVERIKQGDRSAFAELVARYQSPLFAFVKNMVGDDHVCEDLVQETFFSAYRAIEGYSCERASLLTWLFTIARNKTLNELRQNKRRPIPMAPEDSSQRASERDDYSERELFRALDEALAALPLDERMTFTLIEFSGLSIAQVALIEGLKESSIRSRLSRGRAKLRKTLNLSGGEA